jgi:Ca-activated chloride channel homolog
MNIAFLNPAALVLLGLLPIFAGFLVWRQRVYQQRLAGLGDSNLIARLIAHSHSLRYFWQSTLWLCACGSLVVALSRPVWGVNTEVVEVQGVSVVMVIDVSNSMMAQDVLPSRLARAKLVLDDLAGRLRGNEVALVVFAGTAFVLFPLTNDIDTAQTFLRSVNTGMITQQGTAVGEALMLAMTLFDDQRPTGRILVLATDGENHEGDLERALNEAEHRGVTVHTLGFGDSDGAPVPILSDSGDIVGYRADSVGRRVESRLDEATLQAVANRTGGVYQRASTGGPEINNLVRLIAQAETGLLDSRTEARGVERFGIFVLIAVVALALESLLSTMNGRQVQP